MIRPGCIEIQSKSTHECPAKFAYGEFGIEAALSSPTNRRAVAAEMP
jgi:hypothetical protein